MRRRYAKGYSFTLSRGQIIFLALLILLVCGTFFSLGLVGGYGMFASSLRQQLPNQEDIRSSQEKSEAASFYESLVDDAVVSQSKGQTPVSLPVGAHYQVQVGAFRQEKEARALQDRLRKKGYKVTVSKAEIADIGTWFRVRVGNCSDKNQAQELASRLKNEEHLPTLIVK